MNESRKLLVICLGSKELRGQENTNHTRSADWEVSYNNQGFHTHPNNIHSQAEKLQPRLKYNNKIWPELADAQCHVSAIFIGALFTRPVKIKTLQPNQIVLNNCIYTRRAKNYSRSSVADWASTRLTRPFHSRNARKGKIDFRGRYYQHIKQDRIEQISKSKTTEPTWLK